MTTQILLGNGYGLALATDSAVTVDGRRTYETSEKLILLGDGHYVAVLVSGAVTQFSLPIQVLVSEWAKTIKGGQLRKVLDYRESFMSWLRDNVDDFPEPNSRQIDAFWGADKYLRVCWSSTSGSDEYPTIKEKTTAALQYLEYLVTRHETYPIIDRFVEMGGESAATRLIEDLWVARDGFWEGLDSRINYWFDDIDPLALNTVKTHIKRLLILRAGTWGLFGDQTTVVFAGFGAKEMVPAMASVDLFGGFRGWVSSVSHSNRSADKIGADYFLLETIGQSDYIDNILLGYRSELIETAAGALQETGAATVMMGSESGADDESLATTQNMKEQLWTAVEQGAEEQLLRPLRRAIAAMPLRSLADAARSLVGVQALGKAISAELQTTGGRIEVATISRADGVRVAVE